MQTDYKLCSPDESDVLDTQMRKVSELPTDQYLLLLDQTAGEDARPGRLKHAVEVSWEHLPRINSLLSLRKKGVKFHASTVEGTALWLDYKVVGAPQCVHPKTQGSSNRPC